MSEIKKTIESLNKPLIRNILFILFLLVTFLILYGSEIPFLRPQSVHQWRQSDSASYALNYYQNNKGFLHPQTMNLAGKEGRVVSEFPIIYYLSSKCYKFFGMQEVYLRLISYLFFATGLFFLFKLSLKLFDNRFFWAFLPPLFLLSAPYISYYALNFLPNVPALGMTLAAWYFYFKWWKKERSLDLWVGMGFMAIGMLLKPIVAISLVAFIMTSILKFLGWFSLNGFSRSVKSKIPLILSTIIVIGVNLAWIFWVKDYNDTYGNHQNLMGVLPIWDMEKSQILDTLKLMKIKWGYQLYWPPIYLMMIASLVFIFIFRKKINKELFISTILLIMGQFCYVLLYFDTYYHHDYYLINVIIAPLFIVISAIQALLNQEKVSWLKPATSIVLVLAIFMSFKHSRFIIQERYFGSLWEGVNKDLETIEPYLREIGVNRQDYVVSVPDRSPNISLYMMNQQGWTEIFNWEQNNMHHFAKRGAKYLIINDPAYIDRDPYKQYTYNKVGQYKSISVFKLDQSRN